MLRIFTLLLFVAAADKPQCFPAHRLVQYKLTPRPDAQQELLGSWKASVTAPIAVGNPKSLSSRRVLFAPVANVSLEDLEVAYASKNLVGIVLLVPVPPLPLSDAPRDETSRATYDIFNSLRTETATAQRLLEVEQFLATRGTKLPIFFAHETAEEAMLLDMIAALDAAEERRSTLSRLLFGEVFTAASRGPEASLVKRIEGESFEGWLASTPTDGSKRRPTVAIVTHYDAFAAAPGLALGGDTSASGAITWLEMQKVLSAAYEQHERSLPFDVLFLMTPIGNEDFGGLGDWLRRSDLKTRESIDFAIYLDSVSADWETSSLQLLVPSDAFTNSASAEAVQFLETMNATAVRHGIKFTTGFPKFSPGRHSVWGHEKLMEKRIPSGTLTHRGSQEPLPPFPRGSIFDANFDADASRRIEAVVRFLTASIAGDEKLLDFGSLLEDIELWQSLFAKCSRFLPLMKTDKHAELLHKMKDTAESHLQRFEHRKLSIQSDYTFYVDDPARGHVLCVSRDKVRLTLRCETVVAVGVV
eukprot:Polyplicarium_translucidae@DN2948_c0_g1_i4.p1